MKIITIHQRISALEYSFKLFNKIETWEYIKNALGEITYSSYNYERYNQLLTERINEKERIYSAAYIMPSGKSCFGFEKTSEQFEIIGIYDENGIGTESCEGKKSETVI